MHFARDRCLHCRAPIFRDSAAHRWGFDKDGHTPPATYWYCGNVCYQKAIDELIPPAYRTDATLKEYLIKMYPEELYADVPEDRLNQLVAESVANWNKSKESYIRNAKFDLKFAIDKEADHHNHQDWLKAQEDWAKEHARTVRKSDERTEKILRELRKQMESDYDRQYKEAHLDNDAFDFELLIQPKPVPENARAEHTHILGPSGSGKTTLIQQLILADLAKDDPPGMVIIDPKGLMVERLQSLDVFNPDTGRLKDRLIIVDPTHDPPPALNMFHAASKWNRMWSETQRQRIQNQAIETFAYIFSSTGSPLTDKQTTPFGYAVRLMFSMESTILTLLELMDDPTRTDEARGPKYSECKFAPFIGRLDPISQGFFQNEFFASNYRETRQQIKARIYGVLQHPEFVRMFEARERKLDMLDCLQNKSIVLVNTARDLMGRKASELLGRYMIALTLNAAFSRFTLPKEQWYQAHLIIDEFQDFAEEEKTSELLRIAREYRLAVTLAHQQMHSPELTEGIRASISTNTTVKYSSSPEGVDIGYMARDLRCEPEFLTAQTKTPTEARFACFVRGMVDHPFAISIPFGNIEREPQMSKNAHWRLLEANAARLSSPKEERKSPSPTFPQYAPVAPIDKPEPPAQSTPDVPEAGSTW